jgi:uncharacterized protein with PQ loop repeat
LHKDRKKETIFFIMSEEIIYFFAGTLTLIAVVFQLVAVVKHGSKSPSPLSLLFLVMNLLATVLYGVYGLLLLLHHQNKDGSFTGITVLISSVIVVALLLGLIGVVAKHKATAL